MRYMPGSIHPHIKPLFKQNDVFRGVTAWSSKNACVGDNGGPYNLYDYADAYFDATRGLLELALSAPDIDRPWITIDLLVYPICMNFRHAVELFIKYLISALAEKTDSSKAYETSHSLADNWENAKELIKTGDLKVTEEEMKVFDTVVKSIHEVDPRGQIFRYPESIRGDQHT